MTAVRRLMATVLLIAAPAPLVACGGHGSSSSAPRPSSAHATQPGSAPTGAAVGSARTGTPLGSPATHALDAPATHALDAPATGLVRLAEQVVGSYVHRAGAPDPRYWQAGSFIAKDGPVCWWCYDSAASAAALLSRYAGAPALRQVAIDTFDHAIDVEQKSDGHFAPDGITTGFFTVELGLAYLALRESLDARTRRAWSTAISKAARYLLQQGDLTWYVNGNVNLRQTEVMWLAWVATGDTRFHSAYLHEWQFTIAPDTPRWRGYGLRLARDPSRADGADGAGYLTETGRATPGFDPNYTMVQLDTATQLYVLTRDQRYLRLMNLLFNQERPRIDAKFTLNAKDGSRKSFMLPFMSSAPAVLVLSGDRPDLRPFWSGQLRRIRAEYRGAMHSTEPSFYRGITSWLLFPALALGMPR